jgi:long-chain acyl-CoA synthetase
MRSQKNILSDIADVLPFIDFSAKSVGVLPPQHTYGSTIMIVGQACIGCNVYLSGGLKYILGELKNEKPGHLVLVPLFLETFYRKIIANIQAKGKLGTVNKVKKLRRIIPRKLRRKLFKDVLAAFGGEVNMIVSGGAAINQEIMDTFDTFGITVLNGYGITECSPLVSVNHNYNIVKGSVGIPLTICDVKIDDPNENGEGEICIKGPNVMLGYYKDEQATADAFTEDGYFRTGDYGKIGKKGALFITGRKKNLIILSNGKNVYPEEIENEFVAVPGVLDIIVYEGKSRRGDMYNSIVAEIYPDEELLAKNNITDPSAYFRGFVDEYNKTAVAYKKIGVLKVRTEPFPKNTLRKIMRFKLDMSID